MPVSAAEREFLLAQVDRLAQTDLTNLWRQAEDLATVDFFTYVRAGFPEIADVYHQTAGQLAATWFEESNPASSYVARVVEPIVRDQLLSSAEWALGGDGEQGLTRMEGSLQRAIYNGARDTVVLNVEATGSRWIRVARPNACEFCRLLATRTGQYAYRSKEAAETVVGRSVNLSDADRRAIASGQMSREEALARRDKMQETYQIGRRKGQVRGRRPRGKRKLGEKYHDFCHCQAVEVRDNQTVDEVLNDEQRKLFQQWNDEYDKAVANAGGASDTKKVLSAWRQQTTSTRLPTKVNALDRSVLDSATSIDGAANFVKAKYGIKVDQLIDSPMKNGIPIEESMARGADVMSAAKAAKPHFIDARVARETGQAVDDVLTKYPFLTLDEVNAEFYPTGNPLSSMAHARPKIGADGKPDGALRVSINGFADAEGDKPGRAYDNYIKSVSDASHDNKYKDAVVERPAYAVVIHEMGHVVDYNSGGTARTRAADALRAHITSLPEAEAIKKLPKIVAFADRSKTPVDEIFTYSDEYQDFERQWLKANLVSAYSFQGSSRENGVYLTEALAEAFADVELRGDKAEVASKIIHKAMLDAAREYRGIK